MSSIAGLDLIAIGDSEAGRAAWREIESKAHYKYKRLVFPDNNGANCLFVNGVVLHPPKEEYPESFKIWETLDCLRVAVPNSEMAKADGSLTCNSIRIMWAFDRGGCRPLLIVSCSLIFSLCNIQLFPYYMAAYYHVQWIVASLLYLCLATRSHVNIIIISFVFGLLDTQSSWHSLETMCAQVN